MVVPCAAPADTGGPPSSAAAPVPKGRSEAMTITDDMGIAGTLARIREITAGTPAAAAVPTAAPPATSTATSGFARQLAQAAGDGTAAPATTPGLTSSGNGYGTLNGVPVMIMPVGGGTSASGAPLVAPVTGAGAPGGAGPTGQSIARIASAELGVREQPSGSNDGPRIAEYRTATRGAGVGPWCAYFTSWVTAQAGVPIGPDGRGEGWVPNVERWGRDTGRWIPSGQGSAMAGDLVIFDRNGDGLTDHIGVVTGVRSDGGIETVEGNSSDAVSRRSYGPGEWAGLVRVAAPGT